MSTPQFHKMKQYSYLAVLFVACLANFGCQQIPEPMASAYTFITPTYDKIELLPQSDTLHFALDSSSYNQIRTFNYFTQNNKPYIVFFDKRVRTLNFYNFITQSLVASLVLKKDFEKGCSYIINFDSIILINDKRLILIDSAGNIKNDIANFEDRHKRPTIDNETPPLLKNNILYTGTKPGLKESSLKAQHQWNIICGIDLANNSKLLYYNLPATYWDKLYGNSFLAYSYCINNRGNFVFSFPADTNIYETNLVNYNKAYFAKSQFQTGDILPVSKKAIDSGQSRKEYYLRDAYGTIYFDPSRKRYVRFAKQKITEADYLANRKERERSVIILNEDFKIIGESLLDSTLAAFKTIFFTPEGGMYIRVKSEDEQAIHFVRLEYSDLLPVPEQLTHHQSKKD